MPPAASDWITLAEASEILDGREHPVPTRDDRDVGPDRQAPEHQARRPAVRPARRGPGARRRRRAVSAPRTSSRRCSRSCRADRRAARSEQDAGLGASVCRRSRCSSSGIGASSAPGRCIDRFNAGRRRSARGRDRLQHALRARPAGDLRGGVLGIFVSDPSRRVDPRLAHGLGPAAGQLRRRRLLDGLATASTVAVDHRARSACVGHDAAVRVARAGDRGDVHRRARPRSSSRRRSGGSCSIVVIAGVIGVAIVAPPWARRPSSRATSSTGGGVPCVESVVLLALPYVLAVLALASSTGSCRRFGRRDPRCRPPTIGVGVLIVAITQVFAVVAPRLLGANFVYGTLGAMFVALAWLELTTR